MNFTYDNSISPSFAENIISKKLKEIGVIFYREVKFKGCRNISTGAPLRYDFYIPKYALLIEFDGSSHNEFEVQLRDAIKDKFARDNKIKLVRITGIKSIDNFFSEKLPEQIKGNDKAEINELTLFKRVDVIKHEVARLLDLKKISKGRFAKSIKFMDAKIKQSVVSELIKIGEY